MWLSSIFSLPADVESHIDTFTGWVAGWLGGWFKSDNKAKLSPAGAGAWADLGHTMFPVNLFGTNLLYKHNFLANEACL